MVQNIRDAAAAAMALSSPGPAHHAGPDHSPPAPATQAGGLSRSGRVDRAAEEVGARLFPDLATFKADDAKRFAWVEEHWDMIVRSK
ncbi:MAG: hypothetical protein A3E77_07890 [Sphingopyxis sp. RIFCSPHIGHO2_12_FULL_65_19]|nr:MAG: hypothetical protein A3E77_07890 [Sphingopyxis sp. RIFCSPHIGHO2_12_FULL_65_19]